MKFLFFMFLALASAPTGGELTERTVPTEEQTEAGFTVYRIHGVEPPLEWQISLYTELEERGIEWYMPYAVCQVWQESRWNRWSDNGRDKGITQQKGIYWSARAARYGLPGADIWDVNAQFHVYSCMMSEYIRATGNDIGRALSLYFYGAGDYAEKYVADVMSHIEHLEEVRR